MDHNNLRWLKQIKTIILEIEIPSWKRSWSLNARSIAKKTEHCFGVVCFWKFSYKIAVKTSLKQTMLKKENFFNRTQAEGSSSFYWEYGYNKQRQRNQHGIIWPY